MGFAGVDGSQFPGTAAALGAWLGDALPSHEMAAFRSLQQLARQALTDIEVNRQIRSRQARNVGAAVTSKARW